MFGFGRVRSESAIGKCTARPSSDSGRNSLSILRSDLPRYQHLRDEKTFDGRNVDEGTRGLGSEKASSVGEENLLCLPRQKFWQENILIHEFAHSMRFNMPAELSRRIEGAYESARQKKLYLENIYMMANSQEYWAEAAQAWFNATARRDVNGGINSRSAIRKHDPEIASLLLQVYGETEIKRVKNCAY